MQHNSTVLLHEQLKNNPQKYEINNEDQLSQNTDVICQKN